MTDLLHAIFLKKYYRLSNRRCVESTRQLAVRNMMSAPIKFNRISSALCSERTTDYLAMLILDAARILSELESDFAFDATGFGTTTRGRYATKKYGVSYDIKRDEFIKIHLAVGIKTHIITGITVTKDKGSGSGDSSQFPELLRQTSLNFTIKRVMADSAYLGEANMRLINDTGGEPFIRFKMNQNPNPKRHPLLNMFYHRFLADPQRFNEIYGGRNNAEVAISAVKRVFNESVLARDFTAQTNEILTVALCHNLDTLVHCGIELGMDLGFLHDAFRVALSDLPDVSGL